MDILKGSGSMNHKFMNLNRICCIRFILWISFSQCIWDVLAEEKSQDPQNLPELTVSASRLSFTSTPGTTADNPVHSTTFFQRTEIEGSYQRNPNELLRGIPGLSVYEGPDALGSAVDIRGANAGHGMVMLDGVPFPTTIPGLTWFNSMPVESLESIAVIRGTDHAYHANQALGGSIQLRSKTTRENYAFSHLEGGSFGALRGTLSGGLRGEHVQVTGTVSRIHYLDGGYHALPDRGNPERDPIRGTVGLMHYASERLNRLTLDGTLYYKDARLEADLPSITPAGLPDFVDDPDTHLGESLWLTQHTVGIEITDSWSSRVQIALTENKIDAASAGLPVNFLGRMQFINWRNTHRISGPETSNSWLLTWGERQGMKRGKQTVS